MCSVTACAKSARNAGMCWAHYKRVRRHGDPLGGTAFTNESLAQRVARGLPVTLPAFDCWPWTRGRSTTGYGVVTLPGGGSQPAHRAAYELLRGAIPEGLELDHLCRNRACVNPAHLEPVTRAENVRRGWPFRADWKGAV